MLLGVKDYQERIETSIKVAQLLGNNPKARPVWNIGIVVTTTFRWVGAIAIILSMFIPGLIPFGVVFYFLLGGLGQWVFGVLFAKKYLFPEMDKDTLE